jgi:glycosyltransferase involved in cell wall biosynthesis
MKTVALLRGYPKDATYLRVVKALAGEYRVICFLWDRQGDFQPPFVHPNVTYRLCKTHAGYHDLMTFLKIPLFNLWLLWQLLSARLDRIHAIDLDTGIAGFVVSRLKGRKFVYQCIDAYYAVMPKGWPRFLAWFARRIENYVISHSDLFIITDMLRMPQHEGARPKQLIEFANVMPLQLPHGAGECLGNFVVGYIGSLNEGRNLFTLIQAVSELKEEGVTLVIGGFGKLENEIREQAERFENVTFIPWVPYERLLELESGFDVLAIVYDKDDAAHRWASPNKFFEGMALGKPVIVGEGTIAEQRMMAADNGVAVPYGCKEELKQAILLFKKDPQLVRDMGAKGKTEFERNWRPELMEKRLLEAYAHLGTDQEESQS